MLLYKETDIVEELWEKDAYLRPLSQHLFSYDLISFDVFDTILFRTCNEPGDVFERIGHELLKQYDGWPYQPVAFAMLRKEAEQKARSHKPRGVDCTLDEILAQMPFPTEVIQRIRQLEIDCEKQAIYLNQNIYSFMRHCFALGKKIVLVSDTCHSKGQIMDFLSCAGADTQIISDLFVSSEWGFFKSGGGLFDRMLPAFPGQDPKRVLHIGDNVNADVEGAKKAGINALHYPVVPHSFGSIYDFERSLYKVHLGEITSLRCLAAASHEHEAGSQSAFFHALGAEIIGPAYALFAQWVVRYAVKRGIKIILPFMREGELFAKVISRVIEYHGLDIVCTPLFISRQPAFISSFFESNYEERISQTLLRGGRLLKTVFDELGLDVLKSSFADAAEQTLKDLKENGAIKALEIYLSSQDIKSAILRYSAAQRELMLSYLQRLTSGQPALTVDIGTKGTTESYLLDIYRAEKRMAPLSHVLMMGSMASNVGNILSGLDITAWLGIAGENDNIISRIKYQVQVLESLVNATCGSLLRYEQDGGKVRPVLEKESVSEHQRRMVDDCWGGIVTFQEYWLTLASQKSGLCETMLERKMDFLNMLLRLIEAPAKREAELLGSFYYFDGFNARRPEKLSGTLPEGRLDDLEIRRFIAAELKNGGYWPQAAVEIQMPEYFNRLLLNSLGDSPSFSVMLAILEEIKARKFKVGVIFGASELGRKFQMLAQMLGVPLACYVDSNKRLHGTGVNGLIVLSLDDAPANVDYFVIATYIYAGEIRTILEMRYPDKNLRPVFFDFGE